MESSVQFINFIQFGEVEIGARWSVAVCVETARRNVTGRIPHFSNALVQQKAPEKFRVQRTLPLCSQTVHSSHPSPFITANRGRSTMQRSGRSTTQWYLKVQTWKRPG
ncbi:uncharacterized protein [Triticum aestivum]|uniref:uncharacterized protein isoform X2 n=1 Tax=Triticum aestivum TaxID=4565 RepID=UPI001D00F383|nr:uncharacterized protein LOC123070426 isoform X2 [Triticum aestivum]